MFVVFSSFAVLIFIVDIDIYACKEEVDNTICFNYSFIYLAGL